MRLLYGQPLEKQVRDLVCLCEHFDRAQQDVEDMIAAYKNQDLKRLGEVMDQQFWRAAPMVPRTASSLSWTATGVGWRRCRRSCPPSLRSSWSVRATSRATTAC